MVCAAAIKLSASNKGNIRFAVLPKEFPAILEKRFMGVVCDGEDISTPRNFGVPLAFGLLTPKAAEISVSVLEIGSHAPDEACGFRLTQELFDIFPNVGFVERATTTQACIALFGFRADVICH
jgi:hypothetical protein